jgi:hypothetical protein
MDWLDDMRMRRARKEMRSVGVPEWVGAQLPVPAAQYLIWATPDGVDSRLLVRRRTNQAKVAQAFLVKCQAVLAGMEEFRPGAHPEDLGAPTALVRLHGDNNNVGIGHGSLGRPTADLLYSYGDMLYLAVTDLIARVASE